MKSGKHIIISDSSQRTMEIAQTLGSILKGGEIIGLIGELGAGKTCFIQGLAKGMGISQDQYVRSPTFTLINEYSGKIPLYHFDLYRLENPKEVEELGYEEYFYGNGVTAVEWYERLKMTAPKEVFKVELKIKGKNTRELYFSCVGVYYRKLLTEFIGKLSGKEGF